MAAMLVSLLTFTAVTVAQVTDVRHTVPATRFQSLAGTEFDFRAVPDVTYAILSEPHSQLNAHFSNSTDGANVVVTAIGYVHTSGHDISVELLDCPNEAGANMPQMAITMDGQQRDISALTGISGLKSATSQLLGGVDAPVKISYSTINAAGVLQEKLSIYTQSVVYKVYKRAGGCHLDLEVNLLDSVVSRGNAKLISGLLAKTVQYLPTEQHVLTASDWDFVENDLLSVESPISTYGMHLVDGTHMARELLELEGDVRHTSVGVMEPVALAAIRVQ